MLASLALVFALPAVVGYCADKPDDFAWPTITRECKPWAYWWWMGSAVDETNLSRELTRYRDAGMGGVHVIPIYGAKGFEDKYIEYLSTNWMQMLRYAITTAGSLDMGLDMTTGTGWCFGGPTVTEKEACAVVQIKTNTVMPGEKLNRKIDPKSVLTLIALADDGKFEDITRKIGSDGTVDWTADGKRYTVYAVSQRTTSKVKRSAPGGGGFMLNPFYSDAIKNYLKRFSAAFDNYDGPKPRSMYHDSFEYGVNWAPDLFREFKKRRGYYLESELGTLFGIGNDDHTARVKSDYRETVSDMMTDNFVPTWAKWCRKYGMLTRNQAHGSPGNLLDLYEAADIPETEMFHTDRRPLISKFASSAAHVAGRNLVSAETGTWLAEHFNETLDEIKQLMDDMFLSGVNHVFYHGTCYSPDEAPWPGWLFYASTEMNPRNSFWHDVPALNAFIARCQAVLQSGKQDNDMLVYWPIYDFWHDDKGMLSQFSVHGGTWFLGQAIGSTASNLWNRGFSFDYCSDRQLARMDSKDKTPGMQDCAYRAVVVPPCEHMPVETLENLVGMAKRGGTVIFQDRLPKDVPGFQDLEKRKAAFQELLDDVKISDTADGKIKEAKTGKGRILVGDVETALGLAGIKRETVVDMPGLFYIRRSFDRGHHYFIANRSRETLDGWVTLARQAESAIIMDPLANRTGKAAVRRGNDGNMQVYLQLVPGESLILRTLAEKDISGPVWQYQKPAGVPVELAGTWKAEFVSGGPALPKPFETAKLASWTEQDNEDAKRFAGTALYTLTFDAPSPQSSQSWMLDLGRVCDSAAVRLNGQDLGTLIVPPFRIVVTQLKAKDNKLEVQVTNRSANRIRDLDIRGAKWKTFNDINFVNISYRPFDASKWPLMDSGLLGPVTLTPWSLFTP
jgi:hypothetical protein